MSSSSGLFYTYDYGSNQRKLLSTDQDWTSPALQIIYSLLANIQGDVYKLEGRAGGEARLDYVKELLRITKEYITKTISSFNTGDDDTDFVRSAAGTTTITDGTDEDEDEDEDEYADWKLPDDW